MKSIKFAVFAKPKSKREGVFLENGLVVCKINAAPTEGKANARLVELLAQALGVGRTKIVLLQGHTSKHKMVEIFTEMSEAEVLERLK